MEPTTTKFKRIEHKRIELDISKNISKDTLICNLAFILQVQIMTPEESQKTNLTLTVQGQKIVEIYTNSHEPSCMLKDGFENYG